MALPPAFDDPDQRGSVLAFLGRPKMGKTHRARIVAAELVALRGARAIVLVQDPHDQYPGKHWRSLKAFEESKEPWPRVNVFPSVHPCALLEMAMERLPKKQPKIVVVDELDRLCNRGLLVDQVGRKPAPGEYEVKSPTFLALTEHRHYRIDLIGGVRRPVDLAPAFRSGITALWVFRLMSPDDADWVRKVTCRADIGARSLELAPREFIVFDPSDISDIASDGRIKKR